jgi:DNA-binding response OmpR family regulator
MQATGKGINVLLIDDDEGDFILIRELLSEASIPEFEVEWAGAYQTGLDAILCNLFDICLLDFQVDGRNGRDLLEEAARAG